MPAFWVARSKINDAVTYKKYTDLVPGILVKHGGKILSRGAEYQILEGPTKFERFVIVEFPTLAAGVGCFESDEYQSAAAHRRANGAGEVELVMLGAGDGTKR